MSDKAHHLHITAEDMQGNDSIGRYVLLPGSPGRAKYISGLFDTIDKEIITPRHNDTYLGKVRLDNGNMLDVAVSTSGMGPGSTEIITAELILSGAKRIVRVGTSGAVQYEKVQIGSFVIATGAVRDEIASSHYAVTEFPAIAHPDTVLAYERAAFKMGIADHTFKGIVHTKGSLYARAIFIGPRAQENQAYKEHLIKAGVLSSEMEASVMFIMGQTLAGPALSLAEERSAGPGTIKAGTILGIIGGKDRWATEEEIHQIEHQSCLFAIEGLKQLHAIDLLHNQPA
jgi:uridine phosphorylase